jgi:hypothetical protein
MGELTDLHGAEFDRQQFAASHGKKEGWVMLVKA